MPFCFLFPTTAFFLFSVAVSIVILCFYSSLNCLSGTFTSLFHLANLHFPLSDHCYHWLAFATTSIPALFFFLHLSYKLKTHSILSKRQVFYQSHLTRLPNILLLLSCLPILIFFFVNSAPMQYQAAGKKVSGKLKSPNRIQEAYLEPKYFIYGDSLQFKRFFILPSVPSSAKIKITAQTFYRLKINGSNVYADYGFYKPHLHGGSYWRFERDCWIDILPFLVAGENEIEILANNATPFKNMGIKLANEVSGLPTPLDLSTPEKWKVRDFKFTQGTNWRPAISYDFSSYENFGTLDSNFGLVLGHYMDSTTVMSPRLLKKSISY